MTDNIAALIERLEKATGPDRELDADIASIIGWKPDPRYGLHHERRDDGSWRMPPHYDVSTVQWPPTYTASLDAAMTPVPKGHSIHLHIFSHHDRAASKAEVGIGHEAIHVSKAIALCIAALKARAAMEDKHE